MPSQRQRRQIIVLTPEEKRVVAFVAVMFVLGVVAMRYRATHPRPPQPPSYFEQKATKAAATRSKRAAADGRAPSGMPAPDDTPDD